MSRQLVSQSNIVAHALRHAPAAVKKRWVEEFDQDATEAMRTLLQGASHVCPMCKYDAGPKYACSCERPNVQAVRLYCELAEAVGPAQSIIVSLNATLGVKDQDELRNLVESGKRMAQLRDSLESDPAAFLEEGLALVESVLRMQPDKTPEVMKRLKKLSAATVETNGNGAHA